MKAAEKVKKENRERKERKKTAEKRKYMEKADKNPKYLFQVHQNQSSIKICSLKERTKINKKKLSLFHSFFFFFLNTLAKIIQQKERKQDSIRCSVG